MGMRDRTASTAATTVTTVPTNRMSPVSVVAMGSRRKTTRMWTG